MLLTICDAANKMEITFKIALAAKKLQPNQTVVALHTQPSVKLHQARL
jgi:hypothetical protein